MLAGGHRSTVAVAEGRGQSVHGRGCRTTVRATSEDGYRILTIVGGSISESAYLDQEVVWPAIVESSLHGTLGRLGHLGRQERSLHARSPPGGNAASRWRRGNRVDELQDSNGAQYACWRRHRRRALAFDPSPGSRVALWETIPSAPSPPRSGSTTERYWPCALLSARPASTELPSCRKTAMSVNDDVHVNETGARQVATKVTAHLLDTTTFFCTEHCLDP